MPRHSYVLGTCADITVTQLWTKKPMNNKLPSTASLGRSSGALLAQQSVENMLENAEPNQVFKALPAEDWEQLLQGKSLLVAD